MKKILLIGIILGFFISSFLSNPAFALSGKAVILFMEGEVKIKKAGLMEWFDVKEGMVLSGGDRLKTNFDSWAEIGLGKDYGNVVRIQEYTLVELTELGPVQINLLKGELRSLVEVLNRDETFEIKTPMSVCGVRGTGWDTATDGKKVVVDVYEYDVYFSEISQQSTTTVKAGERGILEELTKPIVIKDLPPERMEDWREWKEDFMSRKRKKDLKEKVEQRRKMLEDMTKKKGIILKPRSQD